MRRKRDQQWWSSGMNPQSLPNPWAAEQLLSSIFAASLDNFFSCGPFQCSQHISWINSAPVAAHWRSRSCSHCSIFFPPSSSGHLKTCQQQPLIRLLLSLTLTFPGDFPQRCERVSVTAERLGARMCRPRALCLRAVQVWWDALWKWMSCCPPFGVCP